MALIILVGLSLILYPQAASWFSQKEQSRANALAVEEASQPPNSDDVYRAEQLRLAHQYNDALASGALLGAGSNVPTSDGAVPAGGPGGDGPLPYRDLLNVSEGGFMARLQYDALDIDLPVFHGTDETTLRKGVGHLEGTSLPVGGVGTRALLTAHRGLPDSTLFNDLDKAKVGDTFVVSTLDEVLTYKVVDTQVVEPDDTETILADPDRDLATLVTCTPLGRNTHRILVTGERVFPTPEKDVAKAAQESELPRFPWWAVIFGGATVLGAVFVWRSGYPPQPKKKTKPQPQPKTKPKPKKASAGIP